MEECGGREIPHAAAQQPAAKKPTPKFVSLPSKYNLPEHPIYTRAASSTSTLEGEFELYKNESVCPADTDLVEFWSVRHSFILAEFY